MRTLLYVAICLSLTNCISSNNDFSPVIENPLISSSPEESPEVGFRPYRYDYRPYQLVVGQKHACAIRGANKEVWCWGSNNFGQLGNGLQDSSEIPVRVFGLSNVKMLASASYTTCALLENEVRCWGSNGNMGLGSGNSTLNFNRLSLPVVNLLNPAWISMGSSAGCAVEVTGKVKCWGSALTLGVVQDNTFQNSAIPLEIPHLESSVTELSMGSSKACAVKQGAVWCWGRGSLGQILPDQQTSEVWEPVLVHESLRQNIKSVKVGNGPLFAINTNGDILAWGNNNVFGLGLGTLNPTFSHEVLVVNTTIKNPEFISVGSYVQCIVKTQKRHCWGINTNVDTPNTSTFGAALNAMPGANIGWYSLPIEISNLEEGIISIDFSKEATATFGCAKLNGEIIKCWGTNDEGRLGVSGVVETVLPLTVSF